MVDKKKPTTAQRLRNLEKTLQTMGDNIFQACAKYIQVQMGPMMQSIQAQEMTMEAIAEVLGIEKIEEAAMVVQKRKNAEQLEANREYVQKMIEEGRMEPATEVSIDSVVEYSVQSGDGPCSEFLAQVSKMKPEAKEAFVGRREGDTFELKHGEVVDSCQILKVYSVKEPELAPEKESTEHDESERAEG